MGLWIDNTDREAVYNRGGGMYIMGVVRVYTIGREGIYIIG